MADKHQNETQEQSIKDRKNQLFDDESPVFTGSERPFKEFLRETSALPLSPAIRALLWAVALLVVLMLVAALFKKFNSHAKGGPKPAPKAAWTTSARPSELASLPETSRRSPPMERGEFKTSYPRMSRIYEEKDGIIHR
jgi:hypothetical protein